MNSQVIGGLHDPLRSSVREPLRVEGNGERVRARTIDLLGYSA